MNRKLAQIVSVIFHPLLVPSYLFYLILYVLPSSLVSFPLVSRWLVQLIVFFSTFLIPALGTLAMVKTGYVQSITTEKRSERALPLLFTLVCFATTSYMFYQEKQFDRLFFLIMLVITAGVLFTYLISFFWKISAHSVAIGGALALLVLLQIWLPTDISIYLIASTIFIGGAVLSARLALDAHTPAEVYAGLALGLLLGAGSSIFI
ncbi:MAG: hypothetical protein AVDCRST_MAG95-3991 [uncultured Adhaeribacter sp.]|uniref:Phosphatidic acid phosphatase type 2/haloperoxidase domain-containing protein n=1 Tax=uncultured Adhaeribacter sp. TaxID=448109 RepID=A0A6J4JYD4_9BACT|nr:MAG: hypothetical protein AVDCRST_MAG95-3991 [uncultured Adhaeribacter sp.]